MTLCRFFQTFEKPFDCINLNEVKSSSLTKWFFKSLEELAKCCQKILCAHTDESKRPPHRHILKTVVKVM